MNYNEKLNQEILAEINRGDITRGRELVENNTMLIYKVCNKYGYKFESTLYEIDDLFGYCCLKILKAIENSVKREVEFDIKTLIGGTTHFACKRFFTEYDIKGGRLSAGTLLSVEIAKYRLLVNDNPHITDEEAMKELGVGIRKLNNMKSAIHSSMSINAPISVSGKEIELGSVLEDKQSYFNFNDNTHIIFESLDVLNEKERQVIELFYLKGYTQDETAEAMGIKRGYVNRLSGIARTKMLRWFKMKNIKFIDLV
ncbi:MAG: sigma-70 family RNA polymerase sigma factor [Clostridium sp.]|uniref:sigma-70 family RNA polymerase sigma factor n=1 Tax=Clostridium sp. TaxID=1506 RepID=UPI003F3AA547